MTERTITGRVRAPDGQTWIVRRTMVFPRITRLGLGAFGGALLLLNLFADRFPHLAVAMWVIVGALVLVPVMFVLVGRKPWTIEARCLEKVKRYKILGWKTSSYAVYFVARSIHASGKPPAYVPGDESPY